MNPFQEFQNWLFDGKRNSKIPEELINVISHLFAIRMFKNNGKLNHYLNNYLNTYDVFQIDKEELFYFLKKCVMDYKVKKNDIPYFKGFKKDKQFKVLREHFPLLKNHEIELLSDVIQNSDKKEEIMVGLGLKQDYKKSEMKKEDKKIREENKSKEKENKGISLDLFLTKNFVCLEMEK